MKRWITKEPLLGRALRTRSGQSLVEFALVAPLFFLLVFGITDFGRLFFTQSTLQHALREAGRYAVTGQHQTNAGTNITRVASIQAIAAQQAIGLDVSKIEISSGGVANFAGNPGDTVIISLTTDLKLITPMIGRFFGPSQTYSFTVRTAFKNEPFDQSQAD